MAEKMISVNQLENMKYENTVSVPYCDGSDVIITVKKCISLPEMCSFVENVVESCFTDDGKYLPYVKDFAIRSNTLTIYANFRLPKNAEKQYDLVYQTEAFEIVLGLVDYRQFSDILASIDEAIEFRKSKEVSAVTHEIEELTMTLDGLTKQFEDTMGGLTNKDMSQLFDNLSSITLDEDKLVSAVIKSKSEEKDNVIQLPKR